MNYKMAIDILDLPNTFTHDILRKSYLKKCLKYHPDKNPDGAIMFQNVKDAYDFLDKYENINHNNFEYNYINLIQSFISTLFHNKNSNTNINFSGINDIIQELTTSIFENNKSISLKLIDRLDEETSKYIQKILNRYKTLLNIPNDFLDTLREYIHNKYDNLSIITLRPKIDDVFKNEIFVYTEKNIKYYIPLWHHEMIFKSHIVYIDIDLPDNVTIDINNNIYIEKHLDISDILQNDNININIGEKIVMIKRSDIRFVEFQKIELPHIGIPRINEEIIYDNVSKSSIIVNLYIDFKL